MPHIFDTEQLHQTTRDPQTNLSATMEESLAWEVVLNKDQELEYFLPLLN